MAVASLRVRKVFLEQDGIFDQKVGRGIDHEIKPIDSPMGPNKLAIIPLGGTTD